MPLTELHGRRRLALIVSHTRRTLCPRGSFLLEVRSRRMIQHSGKRPRPRRAYILARNVQGLNANRDLRVYVNGNEEDGNRSFYRNMSEPRWGVWRRINISLLNSDYSLFSVNR